MNNAPNTPQTSVSRFESLYVKNNLPEQVYALQALLTSSSVRDSMTSTSQRTCQLERSRDANGKIELEAIVIEEKNATFESGVVVQATYVDTALHAFTATFDSGVKVSVSKDCELETHPSIANNIHNSKIEYSESNQDIVTDLEKIEEVKANALIPLMQKVTKSLFPVYLEEDFEHAEALRTPVSAMIVAKAEDLTTQLLNSNIAREKLKDTEETKETKFTVESHQYTIRQKPGSTEIGIVNTQADGATENVVTWNSGNNEATVTIGGTWQFAVSKIASPDNGETDAKVRIINVATGQEEHFSDVPELLTLVDSSLDKAFDVFSAYVRQNITTNQSNLRSKILKSLGLKSAE